METRQRLYWRLSFIVSAMLALEVLKGNGKSPLCALAVQMRRKTMRKKKRN
jgi:hypothetical protein